MNVCPLIVGWRLALFDAFSAAPAIPLRAAVTVLAPLSDSPPKSPWRQLGERSARDIRGLEHSRALFARIDPTLMRPRSRARAVRRMPIQIDPHSPWRGMYNLKCLAEWSRASMRAISLSRPGTPFARRERNRERERERVHGTNRVSARKSSAPCATCGKRRRFIWVAN
ncbi:hypothetical protein MSAN_00631100 [Mycena sanguinolenta]|uniref:Secreted protein n=1 Tax=Mycena sanguinolenta TaxID=230812 RepID=A0A8H6Z523_9AGAR|nr:hypothetical protein MSAN_00631100 [Mycena sanguinolenta]